LVDSWKSPEIECYTPYKVLVVGITSNTAARLKFEQKLKSELELRGINTMMSLDLFDASLRAEKMSEEELKELENQLIHDGFDTVLFSKVIGSEDKLAYKNTFSDSYNAFVKFKDNYLMYQDIYYNPEFYNEYTVYHAVTSLYSICPSKDKGLIWKGYIDIIDPKAIEETVNDYVNIVMKVLEEQLLINPIIFKEDTTNGNLLN
jgi:hypothetical protein